MARPLRLIAVVALACAAVSAQTAAGDWRGSIDVSGQLLPLAFHIASQGASFSGAMDSPSQGANGIPLSAVAIDGKNVVFELGAANAKFTGTLNAAANRIDGKWFQGGASFPLTLERYQAPAPVKPKRPQEPKPPFPYRSEDVTFKNASAGITLAGTLTLPPGKGPFTAVLLITGSGPQDRDETIVGHKPFWVLADYLTRRGIAVLRADDRGIGKSGGDFGSSTTADFSTDAEAGVAYLKNRPEVNTHKIGLIGHSEGGVIAPMVAARNSDVAFIVLLAGPGVRGDEIVVAQVGAGNEAAGMTRAQVQQAMAAERQVLTLVEQEKDPGALRTKLTPILPAEILRTQFDILNSRWYRYFLELDPTIYLRKVKVPVLALNGSKDTQVVAKTNLPAIRKALADAGDKNVELAELPGLNHLFQTAKTGSTDEYPQIEETMSPIALAKIAAWVSKQ